MPFRYPYRIGDVLNQLWVDALATADAQYSAAQALLSDAGITFDGSFELPSAAWGAQLTARVDQVQAFLEDRDRALEDYLNPRSQWFSLPGTTTTQTGNCPARYGDVVDGGIGTLLGAGTTATVFTITILDHTGTTRATFTHTVAANVLINARAPTAGLKIGPLVIDSDLINVSVVYGTGAHDGLFELRYA